MLVIYVKLLNYFSFYGSEYFDDIFVDGRMIVFDYVYSEKIQEFRDSRVHANI